jgi:hypothetical protein
VHSLDHANVDALEIASERELNPSHSPCPRLPDEEVRPQTAKLARFGHGCTSSDAPQS